MKNTILTYTLRGTTTTLLLTWGDANKSAVALVQKCGATDVIATWYDDNGIAILVRKYYVGEDYFTGEETVFIKDTDLI